MQDIKEFLRSIGIGKNEAEIYVSLVKEGAMTVLEISKITKIHRSNIYEAIDNLIKQGIVWEAHHSQKKVFCARPPLSLVEYLKQKEVELQEIARDIVIKQIPN
jgi:sugar-specific transcriptional regulator TrmB